MPEPIGQCPEQSCQDTTYYAEDHPQREELLTLERKTTLLKAYDFSDEEIADLLEKRLELTVVSQQYRSFNEESSEYAKLYHPYAYEEFKKFAPAFDDFFQAVLGQVPDKVIVDEERFGKQQIKFIVRKPGPYSKQPLILAVVNLSEQAISTDEIRVLSGLWSCSLSGVPEAQDKVKGSLSLAQGPKQALGLWYAHEKFPEAKADVEKKSSKSMIDVYETLG